MSKRTQNGQSLPLPTTHVKKIEAIPASEGVEYVPYQLFNIQDLLKNVLAGSDKGISDTGKYDEAREAHVREELGLWVGYAEEGPNFDPDGKYLCGTCDMRSEPAACTHVSGKISMTVGSCRIYIHGPELEGKPPLPQKLTQIQAQYGERPKAKGFGCLRCEYGGMAKKSDSEGRKMWCRFFGLHVRSKACCSMEDGKDMVEAPGE